MNLIWIFVVPWWAYPAVVALLFLAIASEAIGWALVILATVIVWPLRAAKRWRLAHYGPWGWR